MAYINLPVVTDSDVLVQQALTNIASNLPGWVPREGNLEVLLLEQFAQMAAEATNVASNVPDTIFEYFGSLIGITPNEGTFATITTTWSLVSAASSPGYIIPAGTVAGFFYGGAAYEFQTISDATIAAGDSTVNITMQAVEVGSVYNIQNIAGFNPLTTYLQLVTPNPTISNVIITGTYATNTTLVLGTDAETTANFLSRLATELQLLAPRPITPSDYALFAQNIAGVYRAFAFDGFNPFTNLLTANDANFTTYATSNSAPANWSTFGNGTVSLPAIKTPGTSPDNYLQFTSSSAAVVSAAPVQTAAAAQSTSLIVTATGFSTTISPSNPALILIEDDINGDEIVVVTAATAVSSGKQTLTIASPGLVYAHPTTATVTQLQGIVTPNVVNLAANANWYQSAAVIQAAGATPETNATARPYMVSVATYVDGSIRQFSSLDQYDVSNYTYTASPKTVTCNILSTNVGTSFSLTYDAGVPLTYANLDPYIVSVQSYIAFANATTSKTHKVFYNSLNQITLDLNDVDNQSLTTSSYNFIPDATFSAYNYTNGLGSSWGYGSMPWSMPSGVVCYPNHGVQYQGTGTALGSPLKVYSQIFNLSNLVSDSTATTRTYTLFASIEATYAGVTYGDITVNLVDASNTSTVLATLTPNSASFKTYVSTFNISSTKDVQVQIVFNTGLNVPLGSSVIVSKLGVESGTYDILTIPEYKQENYFWTPGGLYSPSTFNYARTVTVAPIDANGLATSASLARTVSDYLQARREINFTVQTIIPNYVPIDVGWTAYVAAGYTAAAVQAEVNSAIRAFLNPSTWAGGGKTPPYWDGSATTVRIFDIAGIISSTPGVASVTSVQTRTSYPLNGSYSTSDIVMAGIAQLPIANVVSGTMFTNALTAYSGL
jgi:hypothetical protein